MYKRIIKNAAIYGILPQISKVASFFVLPFITPFLSQNDYGIIGVLSAYIGAFSALQLLGLNLVVTNAFYHHPSQFKWYWRQVYGFLLQWSIVYVIILAIVLYFTIPKEASANRFEIIVMKLLPLLLFTPSDMLANAYYRLNQKAVPIAIRSLLAGVVGVGLNFYFIAIVKKGYMGWIFSEFITATFSGLLFILPVWTSWNFRPIFNFKRRLIGKALKVSLPVIPHYYATYLLKSSDRVVMDRLQVPTSEIGRYSLASNFGIYMETLTNAVNQAVGPNLLELIKKGKWNEYRVLVYSFQTLMLSICFTISFWVPQWVPFLIRNNELQNIHSLLVIIIMGYSYRPMYIGCNQVLFYYEKTNVLWRVSFMAGVINVLANLIFIPIYGVMAAAIITMISFLYMGFSGFLLEHYRSQSQVNLKPWFWLACIIGGTFLCMYFLYSAIIIKIFLNIIVISFLFLTIKRLKSV